MADDELTTPVVTVVGLGPAGTEYLTKAAERAIAAAAVVLVRTARHPAAETLVAKGAVALDFHYERAATFEETYQGIVDEVVAAADKHGNVAYCVPGSPFVLEDTVRRLSLDQRVRVSVVDAMSFLDLVWSRIGIDPVSASVRLVDGERFASDAAGERGPLLVAQVWSARLLAGIKLAVPDPNGRAVVLSRLGCVDESVQETTVGALDRCDPDHLTCVYLPSLAEPVGAEMARLDAVVHELRDRCPWDAAQTHRSLVRHLIEECYEAVEAIEGLGDPPEPAQSGALEEELGDVLCQVLFHCVLAEEEGAFSLADVARTVHDKLVYRHPHVFGGEERRLSVDLVLSQWEELKRQEKGRESLMDGIPKGLPALLLASKIERKAHGVGLGLEKADAAALLAPLAPDDAEAFGEVLFSLARLAAARGIDAEESCRRAATGYLERFVRAERLAVAAGTSLSAATPSARLGFWEEADSTG